MQNSNNKWRLILSPPERGPLNMAIDEAILEATGCGEVSPTLRLYSWAIPCLSLGYSQPFDDVDSASLQKKGWDVVRRPTGGRAILHTDELTYAIIGNQNEPILTGSVLDTYQRIAQVLLEFLSALGIYAQSSDVLDENQNNNSSHDPVCFEIPSNYEITTRGKKIIGSAQARRRDGVLQHGTFPLKGDLTRITDVLSFPTQDERSSAAKSLLNHATTLQNIVGYTLPWQSAANAFITAFQDVLKLDLERSALTPKESKLATELLENKYHNLAWTQKN